jgi:hypothetical protein
LVLLIFGFGVDQFVQEWFIRQEVMRALPGLVKSTSPRQAPSFVPARSSKEDET